MILSVAGEEAFAQSSTGQPQAERYYSRTDDAQIVSESVYTAPLADRHLPPDGVDYNTRPTHFQPM